MTDRNEQVRAVFLAAVMALSMVAMGATAVAPAAAQADGEVNLSLSPTESEVAVGENATYDVVVEDPDNGISAYDVRIELEDGTNAEITDYELDRNESDVFADESQIVDGGSAIELTVSLGSETYDAAQEITIASITVNGDTDERTSLSYDESNSDVDDLDNVAYTVSGTSGADLTIGDPPLEDGQVGVKFDPASADLGPGDTATHDLVVTDADAGVGSFEFTLNSSDVGVAKFTDYSIVNSPELDDTQIVNNGQSIEFKVLMGNNDYGSGSEVTIASVTVEGVDDGTSTLDYANIASIGDSGGNTDYEVLEQDDATVTVETAGELAIDASPGVAGESNDFTYTFNASQITDSTDITELEIDFNDSSGVDASAIPAGNVSIQTDGAGDTTADSVSEAEAGVLSITPSDTFTLGGVDGDVDVVIDGVDVPNDGTYDGSIDFLDDGGQSIAGASSSYTIDADFPPASFDVSGLTAPSSAAQGDTIDVSATVENTGGQEGTQDVEFRVGGSTLDTKTVNLGTGETTTVEFTGIDTSDLSPGDYEHGVYSENDSATATITIEYSLVTYANNNGVIDDQGLLDAVDDWRAGDIDTQLLFDVLDAWRAGTVVA